jgi:two-component system, OmpR family, phosphate regulon sensor histidine kinase PhoR
MQQKTRLIFFFIILTFTTVFILQIAWILNYYRANINQFKTVIANKLDEAIRTEKMDRTEKIGTFYQQMIEDSTKIKVSANYNRKQKNFMFYIQSVLHPKDKTNLSFSSTKELDSSATISTQQIVQRLTKSVKESYKSAGSIIVYHTEEIGETLLHLSDSLKDLLLLRIDSIYKKKLALEGIGTNYKLVQLFDSATNGNFVNDFFEKNASPYSTKLFATDYYGKKDTQLYLYAHFQKPSFYLLTTMKWLLLGSIALLLITAASFYFMYKIILQQKQLANMKDDFIGNMTHEFKTPIATVSAAIESMQKFDALENKEKTDNYLSISTRELHRLTEMVNKVLQISIYEKQELSITKKTFNLTTLLESIVYNFSNNPIRPVQFTIQNALPHPTIHTDEVQLQSILHNLIDNAIKYTDVDKDCKILITCKEVNGMLELAITDNGQGIAEQEQKKIFDKFYRIPSGNVHDTKGTGLGLFYVKNSLAQLQGSITVSSTMLQGSTFTLYLPLT